MRAGIRTAVLGAVVGAVACPAVARAAGVRDDAGLFSADAVARAGRLLAEVKQAHGKDVSVETAADVPAERRQAFNNARNRQQREQFFARWADDRAQKERVDGVFVLITRRPEATVQVTLREPRSESRVFTAEDRDRLRQALGDSPDDEGLLKAVELVRGWLRERGVEPPPVTEAPSEDVKEEPAWLWIFWLVGAGIGAVVCVGLVVGFLVLSGRAAPPPEEETGSGDFGEDEGDLG